MFQIERETPISAILENAPDALPFFQAVGMHCLGCIAAAGENVEEACEAHGIDPDLFCEKLNVYLAAKKD